MCGQSRCQDQSCRNDADLEVMFGGGEDSAQSQDGQDIGILSQGSEETDGADRHLPIFSTNTKDHRAERALKNIELRLAFVIRAIDGWTCSKLRATCYRSIRRAPERVYR